MLVLGMMFGLPLFVTTTYVESNDAYSFGLEIIDKFKYDRG